MIVSIVFDPDVTLGPDPADPAGTPRRIGLTLDDDDDFFLVYRRWGDQYEGGHRDALIGSGVFENLTLDQFIEILGIATDLPSS